MGHHGHAPDRVRRLTIQDFQDTLAMYGGTSGRALLVSRSHSSWNHKHTRNIATEEPRRHRRTESGAPVPPRRRRRTGLTIHDQPPASAVVAGDAAAAPAAGPRMVPPLATKTPAPGWPDDHLQLIIAHTHTHTGRAAPARHPRPASSITYHRRPPPFAGDFGFGRQSASVLASPAPPPRGGASSVAVYERPSR